MTADNADGRAMPPTTHFAIRACCLICGHADHTTHDMTLCENKIGLSQSIIKKGCTDFTLRDFGYPVRTVEME